MSKLGEIHPFHATWKDGGREERRETRRDKESGEAIDEERDGVKIRRRSRRRKIIRRKN